MRLTVTLNGTDKNPYHQWGLKQNPFSQIPKAELDHAMMQLNSLAAEPIGHVSNIRTRLDGWSEEFIRLCEKSYQPGQQVTFYVEIPYDQNGDPIKED